MVRSDFPGDSTQPHDGDAGEIARCAITAVASEIGHRVMRIDRAHGRLAAWAVVHPDHPQRGVALIWDHDTRLFRLVELADWRWTRERRGWRLTERLMP